MESEKRTDTYKLILYGVKKDLKFSEYRSALIICLLQLKSERLSDQTKKLLCDRISITQQFFFKYKYKSLSIKQPFLS